MNWSAAVKERGDKWRVRLGKYKYVGIVILVGICLLLLPEMGHSENTQSAPALGALEEFCLEEVERKLSSTLSEIEGAGQVSVMLTLKAGPRQILAQDGKRATKDGDSDLTTTTVVLSKGSGQQDTVLLQQLSPQYQGALVVCPGGGDPAVKLKLVEAVSALTGLGADKISICKGK